MMSPRYALGTAVACAICMMPSIAKSVDQLPPINFNMKIEGLPDFNKKSEVDSFLSTLKTDTMPKLRRLRDCVQKARLVTEAYSDIKKYGYSKDPSDHPLIIDATSELGLERTYDTNLLRNFSALQTLQDKAMASIEVFHAAMKLPENPTLEQIKNRLTIIDAKAATLANEIAQSTRKEDSFLYLLTQSSALLATVSQNNMPDLTYILSEACKEVPIAPVAAYISTDFVQMADGANEMKMVVIQVRDRRNKMVKYLHDYHKYKLTTAYYQGIGESLGDLKNKILSVFATARLVEEMNGWWQGVITRGLADRYHTYYSQYDEALRRLRATREKAQQYRDRIEIFQDAPESMKKVYRQQADNILATIDRNINKLLKGGWEAQFNQQKLMIDSMIEVKDQYIDSCIPLLQDYATYAEKVKTNEDFHAAEKKYAILIDACIAKGAR